MPDGLQTEEARHRLLGRDQLGQFIGFAFDGGRRDVLPLGSEERDRVGAPGLGSGDLRLGWRTGASGVIASVVADFMRVPLAVSTRLVVAGFLTLPSVRATSGQSVGLVDLNDLAGYEVPCLILLGSVSRQHDIRPQPDGSAAVLCHRPSASERPNSRPWISVLVS